MYYFRIRRIFHYRDGLSVLFQNTQDFHYRDGLSVLFQNTQDFHYRDGLSVLFQVYYFRIHRIFTTEMA